MAKKGGMIILAVCLVLILITAGCFDIFNTTASTKTPTIVPAPPRGNVGLISTDTPIKADTVNVPASGGSFTFNIPSSPLKGMQVTVAPGSYSDSRQFNVSTASITNHTFGTAFNPITPLISIDNGGGYSQEIMTLKIPVTVPAGSFAMGFIYDDKKGTMEGLPTVAQDSSSITVGTLHFSKIVISAITDALLKKDIDSGFRPGVDDWQFPNYGSYIAPKGQCTGQSMTAMWYYITQPDGLGASLNGLYDNNGIQPATPKFWQDDSLGIRFASTVWKDMNWDSLSRKISEKYLAVSDEITWKLFAYSMQVTGEPQMTEIWNTASGSGHAMVVYRVTNGQLYIADPNKPGNLDRRIDYSNGRFAPYDSGDNATNIGKGLTVKYDKITYVAKTALSNWSKLTDQWIDFKMKVIGDTKFPKYDIVWTDDKGVNTVLNDGQDFDTNLVNISALSTAAKVYIDTYRDGQQLAYDAKGNYTLNPGDNKLGIVIWGDVGGEMKYIDFQYMNVVYNPGLTIDPATLNGVTTVKEYTFTAKADSQLGGVRYDWYINGALMQSKTTSSYTVTFNNAGKYTVIVKLMDKNGKELRTAQSIATITQSTSTPTLKPTTTSAGNNLQKLQTLKACSVNVAGRQTWSYNSLGKPPDPVTATTTQIRDDVNNSINAYKTNIVWSGTSFSGKGTFSSDPLYSGGWQLSGTVSSDGKTLLSFNYSCDGTANRQLTNDYDHYVVNIALKNVPLNSADAYECRTNITGSQVQNYVTTLSATLDNFSYGVLLHNYYISTNWLATGDYTPALTVVFGN